jgi:hypothetical protein
MINGYAQQHVKALNARTYENQQFGMKIPYPSEWSVDSSIFNPNAELPTVIFNPPSGQDQSLFKKVTYHPFISVHVARGITSSLISYAQEQMNIEQKEGAIIKEQGPDTINGREAYGFSYVFENTPASGTIKDVFLAIKSNYNTLYIFELQAVPINKFDQYVSILKIMAESSELRGVPSNNPNFGDF